MTKASVVAPDPNGDFDRQNWEQWLSREKWCGGENPTKTAELVLQIVRGISFVQNKVVQAGFATFRRPQLVIIKELLEDISREPKFASYWPEPNTIALSPEKLQEYAGFPFDRIIHSGEEGEISMKAIAPHHGLLVGVEECHHSVFCQLYGIQQLPPNVHQLSAVQYDALNHEFEALGFQVLAANEFDLPVVTRMLLVQRWEAANALRNR